MYSLEYILIFLRYNEYMTEAIYSFNVFVFV
nr:MAG TPA: hypothetical protein [Caudoviricetes sp.]